MDVRVIGFAMATGFNERYEGPRWSAQVLWRLDGRDGDGRTGLWRKSLDFGGQVLTRVRLASRGRTSGIPLTRTGGVVMSFSERGRIGRWQVYRHWEEALEAVGLSG